MSTPYSVVFVTAPDKKTARKLAKKVLEARLAACANLIPKIESHYWWKGKLCASAEILILFKTKSALLPELEKAVLAHHPYDTPEVIAASFGYGNARYLEWIRQSLLAPVKSMKKAAPSRTSKPKAKPAKA